MSPPDLEGRRSSGQVAISVWRTLVGPPLKAGQESRAEITQIEGLPALSLDALTSVAYGPQAIVIVLAAAGASALHLTLPITGAIVVLLVILVTSYRQVIDGYPGGGGAYAVARANLGNGLAQLAAAALLVDYTLTVAVSIAAGIAALNSAVPALAGATVPLCLAELALITLLNMRGLGEAARAFLLPTIVFIVGLLATLAIGIIHPLDPHANLGGHSLVATVNLEPIGLLLILKAFSSGCSALTGVEAIANGVPLFRPPRQRQAKQTEMLLGVLLAVMLLGIAVLVKRFDAAPRSNQTLLSQITIYSIGRGWAYYVVSFSITIVLGLAANTSFGGLPVLGSRLAKDNYLPHRFALRDDRLVFPEGIWALAIAAGLLLVGVRGNTDRLIPLFAIGVFIGFTLAQAGMVVHWRRGRPPGWTRRAAINGLGAIVTAAATIVFVLTKFVEGAWLVVLAIPLIIVLFHHIRRYYNRLGVKLGGDSLPPRPHAQPVMVIVPVTGVNRLTSIVLSRALSICPNVIAVSIIFSDDDVPRSAVRERWARWNPGVRLVTVSSPYHSLGRPFVRLVDKLTVHFDGHVVVLIPVLRPAHIRDRILHNQLDLALSNAIRTRSDISVARIPVPVEDLDTLSDIGTEALPAVPSRT